MDICEAVAECMLSPRCDPEVLRRIPKLKAGGRIDDDIEPSRLARLLGD